MTLLLTVDEVVEMLVSWGDLPSNSVDAREAIADYIEHMAAGDFTVGREVDDAGMTEWLRLLGVATAYLTAAEAMVEAMRGELGAEVHDEPDVAKARELAAREVAKRIGAWEAARAAFRDYAREAAQRLGIDTPEGIA